MVHAGFAAAFDEWGILAKRKFEVVTGQEHERAIAVGIDRGDPAWPLEESLAELERLANTAGAEVICSISQRLASPNPRTFIGQGKADELCAIVRDTGADLVIIDDELTPSQQSNLEKLLGAPVKVIDRTALILDIFALHATSHEGRLQVKLAQNQYLYPRLRGMWGHLASHRMGGGVGSRFGEGESQLEVDRRLVRKRIGRIRRELKDIETNRATQRKGRNESGVFRVALAGYTNAGKSSLMNRLTKADVLAYDKLFATLDSTTRQLETPQGCKVTLTDTVGFIQKLPTNLVEAFHSTLDEIREAGLILLVVDIASRQRDAQIAAVQEVLGQIGAAKIPTHVVYNKTDIVEDPQQLEHVAAVHPDASFASARTGEGVDDVLAAIERYALESSPEIKVLVPYDRGNLVQLAHEHGSVLSETYTPHGTEIVMRIAHDKAGWFDSVRLEA